MVHEIGIYLDGDRRGLCVIGRQMIDLPPINHLQSVRIKLLTIGEINEDPKTAVHLGI